MPLSPQYFEAKAAWLFPGMLCKDRKCPVAGVHRHSAAACESPSCPIKDFHLKGRYLYEGKLADQQARANSNEGGEWNMVWGSNNPPPDVWLAYFRFRAKLGTQTDNAMILGFLNNHFFADLEVDRKGDFC